MAWFEIAFVRMQQTVRVLPAVAVALADGASAELRALGPQTFNKLRDGAVCEHLLLVGRPKGTSVYAIF